MKKSEHFHHPKLSNFLSISLKTQEAKNFHFYQFYHDKNVTNWLMEFTKRFLQVGILFVLEQEFLFFYLLHFPFLQ